MCLAAKCLWKFQDSQFKHTLQCRRRVHELSLHFEVVNMAGWYFQRFFKYFKVRMRRFLGMICGTFTKMNPAACLNRAWLLRSICSFWWYRVRLHFGKTDSCKQAHFVLWKVIDLRNRVQCDQFQLTVWILLNVVLFFLYVNDLIWYKK